MNITSVQQGETCVISISGRMDSLTSNEAGKYLSEQIEKGVLHLVVDLCQMDYLSSSGLRVLVSTLKEIRQRHGDMVLAGVQENIRQLLDLAGFTSIFKSYHTSAEAAASFEIS